MARTAYPLKCRALFGLTGLVLVSFLALLVLSRYEMHPISPYCGIWVLAPAAAVLLCLSVTVIARRRLCGKRAIRNAVTALLCVLSVLAAAFLILSVWATAVFGVTTTVHRSPGGDRGIVVLESMGVFYRQYEAYPIVSAAFYRRQGNGRIVVREGVGTIAVSWENENQPQVTVIAATGPVYNDTIVVDFVNPRPWTPPAA